MRLLFCADPLSPREPDPDFAREVEAARTLGIELALLSYEGLVHEGDAVRAVARVPASGAGEPAVYRGWMLTPEAYALLYAALAGRGLRLVNDPVAYRHAHYLPEWYPLLAGHTPPTVWLEGTAEPEPDRLMDLLRPFGGGPILVKDFVKSQKHRWAEACFIPSAADAGRLLQVVRRFLALQGEDLAGGLVFREFVELQPLGRHPASGMPLGREYRFFFVDGQPIFRTEYWEGAPYDAAPPVPAALLELGRRVRSRFFSMDVARRKDGEWIVLELGDGQVSGLPDHADARAFYAALQEAFASDSKGTVA